MQEARGEGACIPCPQTVSKCDRLCAEKATGMQEAGRAGACVQAVVNISDEALWNLLSACSNTGVAPGWLP